MDGVPQFQKQPYHAIMSNPHVSIESLGCAGSTSSPGPSQDFGRLQDGGHWMRESNGHQHRRHDINLPHRSHRMSPYTRPNYNNTRSLRRQWNRNVCSTCRYQRIKCDGSQPRCGPCQRNRQDSACDYTDAPENSREDIHSPPQERSREYENAPALANDYDTTNYGDSNQTYNGSRVYNNRRFDRSSSAVVHVHVHESGSTSSSSRSPNSSSSMSVTPPISQEAGPISALSDRDPKPGRDLTRSEQYASLLLGCGIGYPLWKPIPRRTPEAEYIVSIGDVGVISDGLPFNILFNITQPMDSLANKDGIPEGVHPPCILNPRWLTVIDRYHQEWTTLICPKNSVSCQTVQHSGGSRVYEYTLSHTQGALLNLPRGGVLKNLERKGELKQRIQKYWRQWYDFSEEQGYLEEHQALYVVTGVEQCSTWGIAAWDAAGDWSDSVSMKLAVDESNGSCSWIQSTARCETQSLAIAGDALKETVFVRGFWVNKFSGRISSTTPSLIRPGDLDSGLDGDNHSNSNGGTVNGSSSSLSSMSTFGSGLGSSAPTQKGGGSENSAPHGEAIDTVHEPQVQSLSVDFLDATGESPCEMINRFAFAVVSRIRPTVLNTECVVFSHDDDWINIMQESDDGFPAKIEIIRRICCEFKFIVENDVIYSAKLVDQDTELVRRSMVPVRVSCSVVSVVLEFRELEIMPEESGQPLAMTWDCTPTLRPDTQDEKDFFHHEEFPPQNDARSGMSSLLSDDPGSSDSPRNVPPPDIAHHNNIPIIRIFHDFDSENISEPSISFEEEWVQTPTQMSSLWHPTHVDPNSSPDFNLVHSSPWPDLALLPLSPSSTLVHPSPNSTPNWPSPSSTLFYSSPDISPIDPSPSDPSLHPYSNLQPKPLFSPPPSPKSISYAKTAFPDLVGFAVPPTATGNRYDITPESSVPVNTPIQPRYVTRSVTAMGRAPTMLTPNPLRAQDEVGGDAEKLDVEHKRRLNTLAARKLRAQKLQAQDEVGGDAEKLAIEHKRRLNTLAARKSRKRKLAETTKERTQSKTVRLSEVQTGGVDVQALAKSE